MEEEGTQTMGIYLEEVVFFLDDMGKNFFWLLRLAHLPGGPYNDGKIIRGNEVIEGLDPSIEDAIEKMEARYEDHLKDHENQVRAKIAILPSVTGPERAILEPVKKLRFHCKGRVEVFPCMKEANNAAIWGAFRNCIAQAAPQWNVAVDTINGAPSRNQSSFAQCAVVAAVWPVPEKGEIKIFAAWSPEAKKRHWALATGDVCRGVDENIFQTAGRKWWEEVGIFFDRDWAECFEGKLPTGDEDDDYAEKEAKDEIILFVNQEKDGQRYPCRPYLFGLATEGFYHATKEYEGARGIIGLPMPRTAYVRWDDLEQIKATHLEGHAFAGHDEATWLTLDFESGKLVAEDNRPVRKEHAEVFRTKPKKLWEWFASLLGVELPQETADEFPTEPPFAARVSGIDKQAMSDDVKEHFEAQGARVTNVELFEIPKHVARVDFDSADSLRAAIGLNQTVLLRRKVKVELWAEEGGSPDGKSAAKVLKPYEGELPEEGPYQVRISGLDRNVDRDEIGYFFWERACEVQEVIYPLKSQRHAADVTFGDTQSMRNALGLNGAIFKQREVNVTFRPKGKDEAPPGSGGGGGGGGKGGGKKGKGNRDRDRDGGGRRSDSPDFESLRGGGRDEGSKYGGGGTGFGERPRLNLKPRTVSNDDSQTPSNAGKSDPFGGARPVSTGEGRSDPFGGARPVSNQGQEDWRNPSRAINPPAQKGGFDDDRGGGFGDRGGGGFGDRGGGGFGDRGGKGGGGYGDRGGKGGGGYGDRGGGFGDRGGDRGGYGRRDDDRGGFGGGGGKSKGKGKDRDDGRPGFRSLGRDDPRTRADDDDNWRR
eukprot:gnl/MRDRNA2_/MRDRNA2_27538_c0_seq1.p1 gnl/MRDRNA2_/MRDRNA2_27538_c0~~gnl/MRDRNA2_/MRDRNA2_27538_c0_seq1.p1  ORF type:complete len:821 (-),score=192.10 gnl/MRDRNA2_/MRDRNA2_27538_c0_seq1:154-2616(-)